MPFGPALIEETRWPVHRNVPDLVRIVVAIDPAVSTGEDADETGIVVAGKDANGHGYVLADQSGRYPPTEWARTAIALYRQHKADRIVAEVNNGGDMVEATIRMVDPNVSYNKVHASRGKVIRAEPVAALYEQGRIHHVGAFPTLEDQQCAFTTDFDRKAAGSPFLGKGRKARNRRDGVIGDAAAQICSPPLSEPDPVLRRCRPGQIGRRGTHIACRLHLTCFYHTPRA